MDVESWTLAGDEEAGVVAVVAGALQRHSEADLALDCTASESAAALGETLWGIDRAGQAFHSLKRSNYAYFWAFRDKHLQCIVAIVKGAVHTNTVHSPLFQLQPHFICSFNFLLSMIAMI